MLEDLKSRAIVALRGRHNSVRHRFINLPREHLNYVFHRLKGGNWTDYYRDIVNKSGERYWQPDDAFNRKAAEGEGYRDFMIKHGLKPSDRFLDFGCGTMRMAPCMIPFLTDGLYVGAEIANLSRHMQRLRERGFVKFEGYELSGTDLKELAGQKFDTVWACSVVTHMPDAEIIESFKAMRKIIKADGRYFFTFSTIGESHRENFKDFFHTPEKMRSLVEQAGWKFTHLTDYVSPDVFYENVGLAEPV